MLCFLSLELLITLGFVDPRRFLIDSSLWCGVQSSRMAKLMGGAAGFQQGAMHVQRGRTQASGLPSLSFKTCAQLEISR
jgi:hypothetical protein